MKLDSVLVTRACLAATMTLEIALSVDELARIVAKTGMKGVFNIKNERKRMRAAQAKKATELKDPKEQILQAQQAGAEKKQRVNDVLLKQAEEKRAKEEQLRKERIARDEEQAKLVEAARQLEKESEGNRQGPLPRRPAGPPAPAPPPPSVLPSPSFVTAPTMAMMSGISSNASVSKIADVVELVATKFEAVVLCAPRPDGQVRTWNDLLPPPANSDIASDWTKWLSPATWSKFPESRDNDNAQRLDPLTTAGNYNEVLVTSASTPVDNPSEWPPQLSGLGVVPQEDTLLHQVLPVADYVVRMTRRDPFEGDPKVFRSLNKDAMITEMALSLHAAAEGIGPPIFAAVAWPWKPHPDESSDLKFGMILVTLRCDGTMHDWSNELIRDVREAQQETGQPPNDMFTLAEQAAHSLVTLCYHIAVTNHINFDIKQGNLLRRDAKAEFFVTDFDAMYYRYVDPDIGGRKACFFVNLLLLAMHIRSYTMSHSFSDVLLRVFAPILVELWTECVRSPDTFGEGAKWLRDARLLPTQESGGSFNQKALRKLPRGAAVGRQLSMMVFEYLFDNSAGRQQPKIVAEWPFWEKRSDFYKGYPPLVPQLMKFVVLTSSPTPPGYADLFEASFMAS